MIRTKLTEMLGIEYPIVQGCMQWISRAPLVAAVSEAGGLGLLSSSTFSSADELQAEIRKIKSMTSKPFAVNLTLMPSLVVPDYAGYIRVCAEEGVKVMETAGRPPKDDMVRAIKDAGMVLIHKCTTVKHALKAQSLGADMVAYNEAAELAERGFLTSSCCPAFVSYIRKSFPELQENISHNMSPMATIAKFIKGMDNEAKTIFIGPCTAKKGEAQLPGVREYVDCVMTFEELQAMLDSRDIELTELEETDLNNASGFGRSFARCGGLAEAAVEALKEQGIDFEVKPVSCSGIEECRLALLKASKGRAEGNFIEGMACIGGCINGAGCLTHGERNKNKIDAHSRQAKDKTIVESLHGAETGLEAAK